jgi:hypothetical protein
MLGSLTGSSATGLREGVCEALFATSIDYFVFPCLKFARSKIGEQ